MFNTGMIGKVIIFLTELFSNKFNPESIESLEMSPMGKDNLNICIKLIDKIGAVVGMLNYP